MKIIILVWLAIGSLVNLYYHTKNAEKYSKMLSSGEVSPMRFLLGGFLTHILWPITIYNNEVRLKDKDE